MTTTKHTPSPWITRTSGSGSMAVGSAKTGEHIAELTIGITGNKLDFDRMEADANLMAESPNLLAALEEVVGQEKPNTYGYDAASVALNDEWRARARAAIAKAKGGAT